MALADCTRLGGVALANENNGIALGTDSISPWYAPSVGLDSNETNLADMDQVDAFIGIGMVCSVAPWLA